MSVKTQGTELYFIDPDDGSIVNVGCVTQLTGAGATRDQIEDTCLSADARHYKPGLLTPGQVSFNINADPSDASHTRLYELLVAGTELSFALGWSDGVADAAADSNLAFDLPTTRSWLSFDGYVSAFPFDFNSNAVVQTGATMQMNSTPVWTPKA